eukprot:MONOS_16440.1-p1 / transcript=MONOS_16440.1 / gene=MONOS_16440 / organism=Monocercomonoides_exilis_PA203 / gene_product=unspecified product / transcript_product=unspecified product / location=Mono_scaffold01741:573-6221(+) / protein_length=1298 / sequence_SO=supercontig / SO=protein_coding / is_pseudo=false
MSSAISRCNVQHLMRVLLLVFVCLGSGATSQPWKSFAETDIGSEKRNGREETSGIAVSRGSLEGRRSRAKSEFSEKQRANEGSWISTWAVISNTSMTIQKAVLQQTRGKSLIDIQSSSALKLWSCRVEIAQEGAESPFRMESGESVLFNISLQLPLGSGRMANLVSLSESKHILSKPGRVSVSSSDFRDLVQCHGSFLPSSPSTSVAVRQCEFVNMTQMHIPQRPVESGTAGRPDKDCTIDSMNCRQVQNPFMGCVVDGASSPLSCFNSSFMECTADTKRHTFDTEEKLFEDTMFSFQSSSEISGGAIFLSGNATLTLKNCLFESCRLTGSSSRAAAVRNEGTGTWTSENTTFHFCSAFEDSGAFDSRGTNSLIMNKCKFIKCESYGLGAGELYNHDTCELNDAGTQGNDIHVNGSWNGKLTLTMSECYSLSEQPRTVFEWKDPEETKEYLKDPLNTLSVIVVAANGFDWDGCGKSEQDSFNCLTVKQGVKRAAEESMEMRIKEGEFVSGEVEVRGGNVTGRGEGKEATVIRAELGEAESALVVISGGEAKLMDMKIVDDGLREHNRVGCLFLVSDGESSLELSGCILAGKDRGITLQMCDVSGFGMGDASFVEAGSTFESVNTTYSSVTRAVGHGTVVGSRVGEGRSVVFENCTVEGCSCGSAEGRGGGVLAEIAGRGSFQIKSSEVKGCLVEETGGRGGGVFIGVDESSTNNFSVGNVTVGGNQARWGRDVFVLCGDLNVSVSSERVFEIENAEGLGVDLAGTDSGLFSENAVDLGYFLEQRYSEVIEISEDGVDVVGCGDGVYPCESFWRGYENVKRGGERKGLKIRDKARICDWYDLSGFTVEGVKEEGRSEITLSREMTIGEGIKSIVWNNGEAGFSRMEFRMPPSFSVPVRCAIESSGSEDGEDLFVFITGYYGEVVYVDGKEGVNNIGCGKEIFRCSTFEYGVERVRGEGMRRIVVGEMCWTERETTLKMVGVESDREDKMSVMEVEEVVEKEKGMVFAAEGASFLRVNFSLPGRLANGQRALIGVCGEGAWVEVRECVFSGKKDCVVGFHLVAGEDGDVGIVKCEVCDVVTESALFVFEESEKERNGRRMELEGCRVRNVRNRKDEASVVSSSVSEGVFVGIGNSTIELCSGGSKSCGGGVCVAVAVDGRFEMNDTVVEGCEAVEGKGGGVYLRSTVEEREALGFVLGNVEFGKNKALVGRDVYVRCWEIESQISERQFVLDLREPRYDRENAIWGGEGEKEEDLIPLIVVYRSELIFVCGADGEGSDSKPCGNSTLPCRSLDYGLSHVL